MKREIRVSFSSSLFLSGIFSRSAERFVFFLSLSLSFLPELNFPPLEIEDGNFDRTLEKMIDIICSRNQDFFGKDYY